MTHQKLRSQRCLLLIPNVTVNHQDGCATHPQAVADPVEIREKSIPIGEPMKLLTPEIARHKQEELRELLDYDPEAEARFMRGDKWLHWVPSIWYKPWTWNFYWGKWTVKLK